MPLQDQNQFTLCVNWQVSPKPAQICKTTPNSSNGTSNVASSGRNERGTEIGTRYRYIDETPLVPFSENATSTSATGATAKTRSRPSNEYVLYAYGEPVAMTADGNASYFGTDILGSVRNVTDKYGAVQANYNYDVFGNPYLSNLDHDIGFGYCGKIYDNGTGLYDYGFRDYAPNQARFTTIDPIRDGANWFSYVVNDPVNYIDPFGLTSTDSNDNNQSNTNSNFAGVPPQYREILQYQQDKNNLSENTKTHISQLNSAIKESTTKFMIAIKNEGVDAEISFSYRSIDEQNNLYKNGRDEEGNIIDKSKVVTYAKGGQSFHNFGLAIDIEVYDENGKKNWDKDSSDWQKVIEEGKKQGFESGAEWEDFQDLPHFENSFGYSLRELREKVKNKEVSENGLPKL